MNIVRAEEHLDSQGVPELFVSGNATDPLTGESVLFAKWLQGTDYARYQSGEPLTVILAPAVAQRISAYRQEQGQDTAKLAEIEAANRNLYVRQTVPMNFVTRSPDGEIVEIQVPENTPALLPAGYEVLAQFPVGVL